MLEFVEWITRTVAWIAAGPIDRWRIRRFFGRRGESVRDIRWAPLTTGWMSHWYDRMYSVCYEDAKGVSRTASVRTNWRTGVVIMTANRAVHEGNTSA